jgi:hypothetical protein
LERRQRDLPCGKNSAPNLSYSMHYRSSKVWSKIWWRPKPPSLQPP